MKLNSIIYGERGVKIMMHSINIKYFEVGRVDGIGSEWFLSYYYFYYVFSYQRGFKISLQEDLRGNHMESGSGGLPFRKDREIVSVNQCPHQVPGSRAGC